MDLKNSGSFIIQRLFGVLNCHDDRDSDGFFFLLLSDISTRSEELRILVTRARFKVMI